MAGRRGKDEGSIYKAADGRWRGAVDLGWVDGKRRRKYVSAGTRAEVVARLRSVQKNTADGVTTDDRLTVEEWLDRWIRETLPGRVSVATIESYSWAVRRHIVPTLGRKRLAALSPGDVERLMQAKRAELSVTSVRRVRAVLVQSLRQAERWGVVARNVAALTDGPKDSHRPARSLTVQEARRLLDSVAGHREEAGYALLLSTGLRRGELLGLTWDDVDLDSALVSLRQQVKIEANSAVVGSLKTSASRRTINLPPPVVAALRTHHARQATERLAAGPTWNEQGVVFPTTAGGYQHPRNWSRAFAAVCVKAGLTGVHPHTLRHSATSIMLASGVPVEVVQNVLGHTTSRMTLDVYTHVGRPQREAAAVAIGDALFGS